MPIAAILSPLAVPDLAVNRLIRLGTNSNLSAEVLDFCRRTCGWSDRALTTYALTVGTSPEENRYMGYPLKLSAREHEILRCLFYRAPYVTTKADLMELCYPEGTQRLDNVTVQIHAINQKAAAIDPRPLVVNVYGKGYRLRDGIL